RVAGRRLPARDARDRGLPGDLARRTPGRVHGRHAGRDGPGPQALEAHAVPGRAGGTTGTFASAAAKAAAPALRDQVPQHRVEIGLPSGRRVAFPVESCAYSALQGTAVVVKDAGDDPDVTHGAHLTATVRWRAEPGMALEGGEGVGVVTKPGLGIEVGEPAITATPRAMITNAVAEVTARGTLVTLSVPGGE